MQQFEQVKARLSRLYEKDRLAHFYTLQLDGKQNQAQLASELMQLFAGGPSSHPDILQLAPQGKSYLIEQPDLIEYMRTWEFRPTNLKYRFFIFTDAHLLSEVILNKMLKQLEEPPAWSCILFLNPSAKKLLATIESRSLKWQVPPSPIAELTSPGANFSQWLEHYCGHFLQANNAKYENMAEKLMAAINGKPWELFEKIKKSPELEKVLAQLTLHLAEYKQKDYAQLKNSLEELRACQESALYNNNRTLRLERYLRVWQKTLFAKR